MVSELATQLVIALVTVLVQTKVRGWAILSGSPMAPLTVIPWERVMETKLDCVWVFCLG